MSEPRPGQSRSTGSKAVRFGLVGIVNTITDIVAFAMLLNVLPPLAANVCSWLVAVSLSYVLNSRWSFERDGTVPELRAFIRFAGLGALISLGISSGAIVALTGLIGVWPAKILGVAVAAVLNFIAARWSIENRLR